MSEQEKKRQRIYDLLNAEAKPSQAKKEKKFRNNWSFFLIYQVKEYAMTTSTNPTLAATIPFIQGR